MDSSLNSSSELGNLGTENCLVYLFILSEGGKKGGEEVHMPN